MERISNKVKKIILRLIKKVRGVFYKSFGQDIATGFRAKKTNYKLERFGTKYGGWIIPFELLDDKSVCYTVGAGEDISFDSELAEKLGANVYIFDPTPRAIAHFEELKKSILENTRMNVNNDPDLFYSLKTGNLEKMHYYDYGIWKKDSIEKFYAPKKKEWVSHAIINSQKTTEYFEGECKKISTVMKELGHNKLDLLKLDVEGAEYEIIDSILEDKIPIKILCVEFDEINFDDYASFRNIRRAIKNLLRNGFEIINIDGQDYTFLKG